jgi:hypothetical protein
MSDVTVSRGDYDDVVVVEGHKHRVVLRSGQYLVMEKGSRWPVVYGDYGSTRGSRESAIAHFTALEAPYYQGEE